MAKVNFNMFDLYSEPVTAIKNDGSIVYANPAAMSFFEKDVAGWMASEIFSSPLLDIESNGAVGTLLYYDFSYTASLYIVDGCRVISILDEMPMPENAITINPDTLKSIGFSVKNSISVFKMALELIRPRIDEMRDAKLTQYTAALDHSYHSLARLVGNLTRLYNQDEPEGWMSITSFDVAELISDLTSTVSYLTADRGVKITCKSEPESIIFRGDADMIQRLLLNLISNSLKHTSRGNEIQIYAKGTEKGVLLRVSDNGAGIPHEKMGSLFSCYELPKSLNDSNAGVGLGLTIVRRIAQLHNGGVVIESKVGHGTVATVTLKNCDDDCSLRQPVSGFQRDMSLVLTELADVLDYKEYVSRNQE